MERLEVEGGLEGGEAGGHHAVAGVGDKLQQVPGALVPGQVQPQALKHLTDEQGASVTDVVWGKQSNVPGPASGTETPDRRAGGLRHWCGVVKTVKRCFPFVLGVFHLVLTFFIFLRLLFWRDFLFLEFDLRTHLLSPFSELSGEMRTPLQLDVGGERELLQLWSWKADSTFLDVIV